MEDFHLKVLQFNRELQANLDNSTVFDSISKVNVEVISTIKELQYWSAICDMVETNRPWMTGLNLKSYHPWSLPKPLGDCWNTGKSNPASVPTLNT